MKNPILLYGIIIAFIAIVLKVVEYNFLIRIFRLEIYGGLIAIVFMGLGIWLGNQLVKRQIKEESATLTPPTLSREKITLRSPADFNISNREYEVLQLIARGYSNQEIADTLYVSISTIKTHTSNLFSKLDVKRRTQAVQKAVELALIPPLHMIADSKDR